MTELLPNLYLHVVKFHYKGSSPLNLYVVKSEERSLLIDTGLNFAYCKKELDDFLKELKISCHDLDVLITHNHPDHSGLAKELEEQGARIYMNPEEYNHKYDMLHCYMAEGERQVQTLAMVGVTQEITPELFEHYKSDAAGEYGGKYAVPEFHCTAIEPGAELIYGEYQFEVIALRGHTFGQIGLWEKQKKLVFCADQIMTTIVPIVGSMYRDTALLEYYMQSMETIKHSYGDCMLLPGHYKMITDVVKEVNRIVFSYLDKCEMMKQILENSQRELTVRQVGLIAYGKTEQSVEREGLSQFSMILAKTFSCLEYLYMEGFISRAERNGTLYWSV